MSTITLATLSPSSPAATSHRSRPEALTEAYVAAIRADFDAVLRGEADEVHHINVYADRLHVHPTHLSNTIKAQTGQSPCDLINVLFLDEARRLLAHTNLTIAQISAHLSFGEPTNFSKYFKKHLGLSPKAYRDQLSSPTP